MLIVCTRSVKRRHSRPMPGGVIARETAIRTQADGCASPRLRRLPHREFLDLSGEHHVVGKIL
jgi:hypothetical protein